jgi:hypothetical protein
MGGIMSRCVLDDEQRYEVSIGWDDSMDTFFAQIIDNHIEGEEDDKIIFWSGGVDRKIYDNPDELMKAIQPYACKHHSHVLRHELLKDKKTGDERTYFLDENDVAPLQDDRAI